MPFRFASIAVAHIILANVKMEQLAWIFGFQRLFLLRRVYVCRLRQG